MKLAAFDLLVLRVRFVVDRRIVRSIIGDGNGNVRFVVGDGYVGVFTINQDTCVGCNMCSLVCPAEGCISMKPVDSGLPSITWKEYQQKLAAGKMDAIGPPKHV